MELELTELGALILIALWGLAGMGRVFLHLQAINRTLEEIKHTLQAQPKQIE